MRYNKEFRICQIWVVILQKRLKMFFKRFSRFQYHKHRWLKVGITLHRALNFSCSVRVICKGCCGSEYGWNASILKIESLSYSRNWKRFNNKLKAYDYFFCVVLKKYYRKNMTNILNGKKKILLRFERNLIHYHQAAQPYMWDG